jgi:hypothetical protein
VALNSGLASPPTRARFAVLCIAGLLMGLAAHINVTDSDGLLATGNVRSLHYWMAYLLGASPVALLFANVGLFVAPIYRLSPYAGLTACALLVNPFSVFNVLDAFNKFSLTFALSAIFGFYLNRRKHFGVKFVVYVGLVLLHPFNAIIGLLMFPLRFIWLVVFAAFVGLNSLPTEYLDFLLGDKADLIVNYGGALASMYGGNYKLLDPSPTFVIGNIGIDILAPFRVLAFPWFLATKAQLADYALCVFMAAGYVAFGAAVIARRRYVPLLVLLVLLLLVPSFVGNVAVIYRHIVPMFPALFFVAYFPRDGTVGGGRRLAASGIRVNRGIYTRRS